jgi:hypothetical protein
MASDNSVRFLIAAVAGLVLAGLAPAPRAADDSARVSRLESEIQQLRSQLNEQARRIERLEEELKRRGGAASGPSQQRAPAGPSAAARPDASGSFPWHSAAAWDRVRRGMTVAEVSAILGEPTSVESVDSYKSLFYRGSTSAGVLVIGHVNFRDERVVAVSKPASQAKPNP